VVVEIIATGTEVCPVKAMQLFLNARPKGSQGYLFCHVENSPLTRYQFGAVLTRVVRRLKLPVTGFKTHSFRIGAATWLSSKGVPDAVIQRMGRWKSNAFAKYIRPCKIK
jgi:site-specific recombinase XerD